MAVAVCLPTDMPAVFAAESGGYVRFWV